MHATPKLAASALNRLICRFSTVLVLTIGLTGLAHATDTNNAAQLQLLYSGNLDGELEPCGCALGAEYGGIQRRATLVDQLRADNPELLLISSGGLFAPELGNDLIRNRFILSGMAQLDYDAIGIQWSDLLHGEKLLLESQLPFSAGNWRSDSLPRVQHSDRADRQLFFSQWLDPSRSPYQSMPELTPIDSDPQSLQQALDQAKAEGKLTVLGTTLTLEAATQLFDLTSVDILLLKSAYEQVGEPQLHGTTLVLEPGSRGQRLGLLTLQLDQQARIRDWQHKVIALPEEVESAARLQGWYDDYNEALRQDYLAKVAQRKAMKAEKSPYVGAQLCQACHQAQHEIWSQSEHAKAFRDLETVGKAYDSHCVGCHVVGFEQPGGYLDQDLSRHLQAVQCENCHGAGLEHAMSGGKTATPNNQKPKAEICAQCHIREHSPAFKLEEYWPKIAHPGLPALPTQSQSEQTKSKQAKSE